MKTDATAAPSNVPGHSGLSGRSLRTKKVASGHCEEIDPEIVRTIPEEELTDNQMEISYEILRSFYGED